MGMIPDRERLIKGYKELLIMRRLDILQNEVLLVMSTQKGRNGTKY